MRSIFKKTDRELKRISATLERNRRLLNRNLLSAEDLLGARITRKEDADRRAECIAAKVNKL
jgi:hypothetical protein